jgi:membrane protein DedA with SNARE-associated domain/rhodanese-related sulfurtransferase
MAVVALVIAVVVGSVLGNALWFAAGRRYGNRVLGWLCRFSLSPDSCVARSGNAFGRWGSGTILLGRFVPGVSLVAPALAGALGMRWSKFLALTALGAALWASVILLVGAMLQTALIAALKFLAAVPAGLWLAAVALLISYVAWRYSRRRREARALAVPRIGPEALRAARQSATPPIVIDVRGGAMQQVLTQRIPGALSLTLQELENHPLPAAGVVVLYCNCPNEASAAAGVRILQSRGHADAAALRGGLDAWIKAGYETAGDVPAA